MIDFKLFADNTTILYSHKNIESKIDVVNAELKEVSNCFKTNKWSVNADKTIYMLSGSSQMTTRIMSSKIQEDLKVILDNTVLDRVSYTKFLGVLMDENLTWKCHIDCVSKTLSRNIGIMNKLTYFVPGRILYTLCCTFICFAIYYLYVFPQMRML